MSRFRAASSAFSEPQAGLQEFILGNIRIPIRKMESKPLQVLWNVAPKMLFAGVRGHISKLWRQEFCDLFPLLPLLPQHCD